MIFFILCGLAVLVIIFVIITVLGSWDAAGAIAAVIMLCVVVVGAFSGVASLFLSNARDADTTTSEVIQLAPISESVYLLAGSDGEYANYTSVQVKDNKVTTQTTSYTSSDIEYSTNGSATVRVVTYHVPGPNFWVPWTVDGDTIYEFSVPKGSVLQSYDLVD